MFDPEEAFDSMSPLSRIGPTAGVLLLGGLASLVLLARSVQAAQSAPSPAPYYYGGGAQGVGYYVTPQLKAATATATAPVQIAARRPQTVGPGARNWATGNRVPLHRPWLNSRR